MADNEKMKEILNDPDFLELAGRKNTVTAILTAIELVVYFGFVALIAFGREFLSSDISGSITMGIPIGIGVIVVSWVLTGAYVWWANNNYDNMAEKVKQKVGGE